MVNLRISENDLGYLRLLIDIISAEENENQLDNEQDKAILPIQIKKEDIIH
jgi:hypothetical protein